MVRREAGGSVRGRPDWTRPDHASWLRTPPMGSGGAEDGAGAAVLLHLASQRRRSQSRLLPGNAHAGGVQAGKKRCRDAADAHRIRFRQDSEWPAPGSVPQKRRRLVAANEEYRKPCRARVLAAFLPRWAT